MCPLHPLSVFSISTRKISPGCNDFSLKATKLAKLVVHAVLAQENVLAVIEHDRASLLVEVRCESDLVEKPCFADRERY